MTGMQAVVGYHWSPATRRAGIDAGGLRIGTAPVVNGVEDVHRNRWISLCATPRTPGDCRPGRCTSVVSVARNSTASGTSTRTMCRGWQ